MRGDGGLRGVFAVLVTPFDDDGSLDKDSLDRCIEFSIGAGAHGLVTLANASEVRSLSDDERKDVARRVVQTVDGRLPVVVGVSAASTAHAAMHARHAAEVGAHAVMAMAPYDLSARVSPEAGIMEYFMAIARAAEIPVIVQNYSAPISTPLPPAFIAQLLSSIPGVSYVKEEVPPTGQRISRLVQFSERVLLGVWGGVGGRFMLDEYRRGACGTMPACDVTDVHVRIWDALERDDEAGARQLHGLLLPLLNLQSLYGTPVYKEVLRRRGVIASAHVREPGHPDLDEFDRRELSSALEPLLQFFTDAAALTRPAIGQPG